MNQIAIIEPNHDLIPLGEKGELMYNDIHGLKKILNTNPKPAWIHSNKFAGNSKYISVHVIEDLLNKLFPFWELNQVGQAQILGNSVVVSVELRIYNPLINQWISYAGIGAVPIEVEKGAHPTDFTKINAKAMHKNVPAAMAYAMKNAAKKIGRIFGSHLNTKDGI